MSGSIAHRATRLRIDPTAWIAPGAVVVGDVTLGARASVWFNTVLRGDTDRIEVGEDSNLQDNSVVHMDEGAPALIGARVTVGHRAVVHGCVIEDECLIGMGSVILSGARIGAGSLIGAASLVREGQQIPPGSLALGSPARVLGPVSEAHRAAIRNGWAHYVALSRGYLERAFARPHPLPDSDAGITDRDRGPMSFLEWGRLVATLSESPDVVASRGARTATARWRARPGPGRWSAHEVVCHLRDCDLEVFVPRTTRVLEERHPAVPDAMMTGAERVAGYEAVTSHDALAGWTAARRQLVARLAPLGRAEWARYCVHAVRGPYPLAEMVRYWVDHDLSHRRQIARALGEAL
jgi:carbonic anhydrase/acetyltransferase-like protein (isoleucine patch superfamily)